MLFSRFSSVISFIHSSIYASTPISQFIPPPLSTSVSVSLFSTSVVSISALQVSSSVPFFYIPHVSNSLFLTYLFYMIVSRSVHISVNDTTVFLLWLSNIPLYICNTSCLSISLLIVWLLPYPSYCK